MGSVPFHVEVLPSAIKDMRRFPQSLIVRIRERFVALGDNPFPPGSKKMEGYDHHYRIRVGPYRIIYRVDTAVRIVSIVRVANRSKVYLSKLF